MVKIGTKWTASDQTVFVVINSIELEGNSWVFYRKENTDPPQEFSCFEESFLERFKPLLG